MRVELQGKAGKVRENREVPEVHGAGLSAYGRLDHQMISTVEVGAATSLSSRIEAGRGYATLE